jgi:type II secretory pathway pseudopilin PulG
MRDLIEALLRNPIILVFLAAWLFSAVAAIRKQAAQQKKRREATLRGEQSSQMAQAMQREANRPAPPPPRQVQSPTPPRSGSAEEIAEAIRRAMGLPPSRTAPTKTAAKPEPVAPRRAAIEATEADAKRIDYDELPQRAAASFDDRAPRKAVVYDDRSVRRTLVEELEDKQKADAEARRARDAQRRSDVGAELRGRKLEIHIGGVADRRARRRREIHRVLDLTRPATVFLAGEVFGKPLALRDEPGGLQPGS